MLDVLTGIVYLMAILTVLVVVHEWGHFICARMFKMRVEDFSVFFGKVLVRLGKRGDTEYNIRTVPLGGFVKIAGMEPDDISGGKPILEAIRTGPAGNLEGMDAVLIKLDKDTMAGIDMSNVSDDIRRAVRGAIGTDGRLTSEGIADLDALAHSPRITTDEHKLIEMVRQADNRAADPGLYSNKPIYQRAIAIFGGPFASLLFGYIIFCGIGMTVGLPSGTQTNVVQVFPTLSEKSDVVSPARAAGLNTGDRIVSVDGKPTLDGRVLIDEIYATKGRTVPLGVERGGEKLTLNVSPLPQEVPEYKGDTAVIENGKPKMKTIWRIGVLPTSLRVRTGFLDSIYLGTAYTRGYMSQLGSSIFSKKVKENVGGPIAMGQMATALQKLGFASMVELAAMFSLGLGVMNLLPIPILDGGHLMLLGWEKLRRRKLSPREVYRAQMVGVGMLMLLITFVMYNDIARTIAGKGFQ